ncbi:MAG TPA: nicotinate (nicotinamide) nucleotide adenylyltransferase [Hanamia sp.]|nr:nicotinate (nicotinamide) nucleotide adenylyltransferase [Hanamia sp.]
MKIGLYFGSFNPIHNGHLIIASHIANYTLLERIWFVISPQNPLKQNASLINENHRKHLIDLAIEGEKKFRSSNIEFKLPRPSYTIDTLVHLSDKYPQHEFSIIMGSDSFTNIKKWKNYEVLLRDYDIIIYERPGFKVKSEMLTDRIKVMDAPLLQISSTHIRDMLHMKKSIRYLVPDVVKEEIERQEYYV